MNPKFKSFLRNFYLSAFFYDFVFAYAVYNILFNIKGLSIFQISLLLIWWSATTVILEVPSGALADYWSRRNLLIISPLIKSLCFVSWFLADGNFYLYALGLLFWTIGSTMRSGTEEAFLYDSLIKFKKQKDYEKILGRKKVYLTLAIGISSLLGGIIANYNLDLVLLATIIPILLSSLFAVFLIDPPKQKSTEEIKYLEYIKVAIQEIKSNRILRYLFIYLTLLLSVFGGLEEFDQIYYKLVSLPLFMFGVVSFASSGLSSLVSWSAYKFKNIKSIIYLTPLLTSIMFVLIGSKPILVMISVLVLSFVVIIPTEVLLEGKLQREIKSNSRATVISIKTMILELLAIVVYFGVGLISKYSIFQNAYIFIGIGLFLFSIWVFANRKIIYN